MSSLLCCTSSLLHHCGSNLRDNRIVQQSNLLFLQLAISAWLTAQYGSGYPFTAERDRVHFLLFCSVWTTLLSPIFPTLLLLELAEVLTGIAAHVVFLFLSWVFWLSGAAAITASLDTTPTCRLFIFCSHLSALEAFAWIEWIILTVGFTCIIVIALRAIHRGQGFSAPMFT
jgi:hypothetical protein